MRTISLPENCTMRVREAARAMGCVSYRKFMMTRYKNDTSKRFRNKTPPDRGCAIKIKIILSSRTDLAGSAAS